MPPAKDPPKPAAENAAAGNEPANATPDQGEQSMPDNSAQAKDVVDDFKTLPQLLEHLKSNQAVTQSDIEQFTAKANSKKKELDGWGQGITDLQAQLTKVAKAVADYRAAHPAFEDQVNKLTHQVSAAREIVDSKDKKLVETPVTNAITLYDAQLTEAQKTLNTLNTPGTLTLNDAGKLTPNDTGEWLAAAEFAVAQSEIVRAECDQAYQGWVTLQARINSKLTALKTQMDKGETAIDNQDWQAAYFYVYQVSDDLALLGEKSKDSTYAIIKADTLETNLETSLLALMKARTTHTSAQAQLDALKDKKTQTEKRLKELTEKRTDAILNKLKADYVAKGTP